MFMEGAMSRRGDRKRALLLLVAVLLASPTVAEERVWRLGVLTPGNWAESATYHVMVPELGRRGFVEGRNLVVLPYWGSGSDPAPLARAARRLAAAHPDVIAAVSPEAVQAARAAAPRTPIVAAFEDDPVADGVAKSLARPGGMVTGIAMLASEGDAKRAELLHDAMPSARRIGLLIDGTHPSGVLDYVKRATGDLGIEVIGFKVESEAEYRKAFDAMREARIDGVVIAASPLFATDAAQLATLAAERRLPTVCQWRKMAAAGCLISYGPDLAELYVRAADFVVRLFAGDRPAGMPFEQPTHFEMAVNGKTAASIGVALLPSFLTRADEVIE
jgi:putative tryptophan/tyrosine transport system substrate-binding protein